MIFVFFYLQDLFLYIQDLFLYIQDLFLYIQVQVIIYGDSVFSDYLWTQYSTICIVV